MKILFFGDSVTDAGRSREGDGIYGQGVGFVDRLISENSEKYTILNRGISGNRIVDLYARIKKDVWDEKPDVINILIGVNDLMQDSK